MTLRFMGTDPQSQLPFVGQDDQGQQQDGNAGQTVHEELGSWHRHNENTIAGPFPRAPREEVQPQRQPLLQIEAHHERPVYEARAATETETNRSISETAVSQPLMQPKRRKAKRACMACQRAHLTCGDERPCDRCMKRGLADSCHDGVRKKAKYLHDAPSDAFDSATNAIAAQEESIAGVRTMSTPTMRQPATTAIYPRVTSLPANAAIANQTEAITHHDGLRSGQELYDETELTQSISQAPSFKPQPLAPQMLRQVMEPNANNTPSAALFNLDIASMNFDNHYGALEFGMLGHITANTAKGSNEADSSSMSPTIGETPSIPARMFNPPEIQGDVNMGGMIVGQQQQQENFPVTVDPHSFESRHSHANSLRSTSSPWVPPLPPTPQNNRQQTQQQPHIQQPHYLHSSVTPAVVPTGPPKQRAYSAASHSPLLKSVHRQQQQRLLQQPPQQHSRPLSYAISFSSSRHPDSSRLHRPRNPSELYESITRPYSYTAGFHRLSAYIHRRFTPSQTLHIAKSLASIRPSLIATNKTLDAADLVFMEKCFQRTLWEYEDFINVVGTPTLVCRRTGEVAAVGREFCVLTGWTREVLLGLAPNLNVNSRGDAGAAGKASHIDTVSATSASDSGQAQPVLLAELLDDESVVDFYDDFAKMAFNDSRGSIVRTCKLLRYKPRQAQSRQSDLSKTVDNNAIGQAGFGASIESHSAPFPWSTKNQSPVFPSPSSPYSAKNGIVGESDIERNDQVVGDKVECSCCWTVKRDVFDIPMLIVMNFLPCI